MDRTVGGKAFREYVCDDARQFVRSGQDVDRRVVLVRSMADIPWHVQLVACLTRARLQEKVFIPLVRCSLRSPIVVTWTRGFAVKRPLVVGVFRAAAHRDFCTSSAVRLMSAEDFWEAVDAAARSKQKLPAAFTCLYEDGHIKRRRTQQFIPRTQKLMQPEFHIRLVLCRRVSMWAIGLSTASHAHAASPSSCATVAGWRASARRETRTHRIACASGGACECQASGARECQVEAVVLASAR